MSVEIDPVELGFRRPFTVEVAQILKIKNPNASPVAFKVKTTAPKQYCVRPNSGRIEPGHEVEVSVLLQAMKQEPPADARCRDKFLVQSVTITGDKEFTNVTQIWDSVERSAIQEKKIRVSWLPATGEEQLSVNATPNRQSYVNGVGQAESPLPNPHLTSLSSKVDATPDVPPPSYSSPHDETTVISSSPPAPAARQEATQEPETAPATIPVPTIPVPTLDSVKSTANDIVEELKEKLAKAEATIVALREQNNSGLKQRKPTASTSEEKTAAAGQTLEQAQRQGTEGVPVQIVAILCLICFLLAYFFF